MTRYEEIERYLENINASQDILVTIDDISKGSITFSVYGCEVTEESLETIYEVLDFINSSNLESIVRINYYPSKNGSQECFNIMFDFKVGEDEESEEELLQKTKDYNEDLAYECWKEQQRGIY